MAGKSKLLTLAEIPFKALSKGYIKIKNPKIIAVAGSVGKTSTKLMVAHLLRQQKRVSCMDDSYNNGIGLYLSVFNQKVPSTKLGWPIVFFKVLIKFLEKRPDFLVLEYGIDHPGDMDKLVSFARPDYAMLTAVTPEHMEYLKDMDTVATEETKILKNAKKFSVVNYADVDSKYIKNIQTKLYSYGKKGSDASYSVANWEVKGAVVDFKIKDKKLKSVNVNFISDPLIRQLSGAALLAHLVGISEKSIKKGLETTQPAASRMRLFDGLNDSTIIDDTTNFSPSAGIEALKALKRLPGNRHIAVLGNMHELGEYEEKGFTDVAKEFEGLDLIVLVGELSEKYFGPLALQYGFIEGQTLFFFPDAITTGDYVREQLETGDTVLVKGPFGGFYLEEAVKKLLKNSDDAQYLTRQSKFWLKKKQQKFGVWLG